MGLGTVSSGMSTAASSIWISSVSDAGWDEGWGIGSEVGGGVRGCGVGDGGLVQVSRCSWLNVNEIALED